MQEMIIAHHFDPDVHISGKKAFAEAKSLLTIIQIIVCEVGIKG